MLDRRLPCSVVLAGICAVLAWGCSGSGSARAAPGEPLIAARQADLTAGERVQAIREATADVRAGQGDPTVHRLAMKELAWSLETPELVRAAALEAILWDSERQQDSLQLVREMLPTEPGRKPVAVLSTAAADQGWVEATPALVRSLARPLPAVALQDRSEYQALEALHPGRALDRVALEVFLDPQTDPGPAGLALDMRVREAAWDLLGRLAPDPESRGALLDAPPEGDEEGRAILADLRTLRDELGVVPSSGEELRWALRLVRGRSGELRLWWEQASAAVAPLGPEQRAALAMRHVEPVRWASQTRPEWLAAGRETLLSDLQERLRGRQLYPRTESVRGTATARAERLNAARDVLTWGDALALLVLDEALSERSVVAGLFAVADADNRDSTTEHGGMLWADAAGFHVQHFPPRGTAAPNDRRFTAPREMIDYSSAALAHFHGHVTQWRNRDYAGPSPEDLDYAARFGRTCLVITGLSRGTLNADVYFPTGAVVDLGELERPPGDS